MGGVAELLLAHDDPAQEPVRGVLLGEGDASEDLQRAVGDLAGERETYAFATAAVWPASSRSSSRAAAA